MPEKRWEDYIHEALDVFKQANGQHLTEQQFRDLRNLLESALAALDYIEAQKEEAYQAAATQGREARTEI